MSVEAEKGAAASGLPEELRVWSADTIAASLAGSSFVCAQRDLLRNLFISFTVFAAIFHPGS